MLDIWRYIAADNEAAADRMLDRLTDVMNMLARQPEAGRRRSELLGGLRSFPAGTYVIFYRIGDATIDVIRVLSGYRDLTEDVFLE